ncbi:sensor histidine kinase [Ramlibacter terrae]|uniref:histidine kinase n=1 Tax=Ramlibacter terrae TaxID=2732511 RepID=A0ABX6P4M5_9BURK|nr:sensor histidine kinase [Ramlibacter terrae]
MQQALRNMVANALHYTPPGTPVTVRVEVADAQWRLVVQDEGPGLPRGQEQAMFSKFRRGRNEPTSAGFGLGLAICAAVAQLHGGSIAAANTPGARLTMELPQPSRTGPQPAEAG